MCTGTRQYGDRRTANAFPAKHRPAFAAGKDALGDYGDGVHVHTFSAPAYATGVQLVEVQVRDVCVVLADIAFGRGNARAMCWAGESVVRPLLCASADMWPMWWVVALDWQVAHAVKV